MMIKEFDCVFNVPDEMIKEYEAEFKGYMAQQNRDMICGFRDSTFMIIETLREDPEKLSKQFYVNSFIKAHAMREALKKLGVLYDA
jgi:hypothetical protein